MKTKHKLLALGALIALVLSLTAIFAFGAAAESTPTLDIGYCNLSFRDSVVIKYAVYTENVASPSANVKLLVWTEPQSEYLLGTQDSTLTTVGTQTISGKEHVVFDYDKLTAKQMTDVIYTRAYAEINGEVYYSDVNKYSILQYAYNKLGKTDDATANTEMIEMLNAMLAYGAAAQKYFDYKLDNLATDEYYQVKVEGGTLADGSTSGLFKAGAEVTFTAPETIENNTKIFVSWTNRLGSVVGTTSNLNITVGNANETYTANYKNNCSGGAGHDIVVDSAVPPTCTENGLTEGKHCQACGEVLQAQEAVPATGHSDGEWVVDKEMDATQDGHRYMPCANCGITLREEVIPAAQSQGLAYTVNSDNTTCTITGIGECTDKKVYIPDTIDGYKVTAIGNKAFSEEVDIIFISIPNTVISIGTRAFYGCTGITEITIPKSVNSIGTQIFYKATNLKTVYYNGSYGSQDNPFLSTTSIDTVVFNGTKVPSYVLYEVTTVKNVVIGKNVTSISYAFYNCKGLTSVTFEENGKLTSIGSYAFYNCTSLESVNIPDSVTSISSYAFYGCSNLKDVYVTGLEAWLNISFGNYYAHLNFYGKLHILDFDGKEMLEITIPDTFTKISDYTFKNCTATKIIVPDSVTSIGDSAFSSCSSLTSVTIPDSVTSIGNSAFEYCSSLTSITIPDSVTSIGDWTFYNCSSLTSITIPDSVISVGDDAFFFVTHVYSRNFVYYYGTKNDWDSVECLYSGATIFYYSETQPEEFGAYWHYVDGIPSIWNVIKYTSNGDGTCEVRYGYVSGEVVIPSVSPGGETVTSISDGAFSGCTSLTSIKIPDSVTSIGEFAFSDCSSLTSITIPECVTSIGSRTFMHCSSLTSVTIPDSVTSIGGYAFCYCYSLTSINFEGTMAQWKAISRDGSWDSYTAPYTVCCTDGDISK